MPALGLGDPRPAGCPRAAPGVTVFVTKASSERATAGRGERVEAAARVQEEHSTGPSTQRRVERAVELDDAAVAGAVAARHRRLPGELGVRGERAHRLEHRLGPAGEHVAAERQHVGDEHRVDHDLGVRDEHGRLGVARAPEAEQRRRLLERLGQVRERRDPDAAADEERPRDVEPEAVSERAEDGDPLARARAPRARGCRGPTGSTRKPSSPPGRAAERERPRQRAAGRLEHEELARARPGSSEPRSSRTSV